MTERCDLLVIGGGINGCGIARDAVGRGYSVILAEKDDLASGTSSGSTKLIHGGLRYLEYYEFRLVHEALAEREVLWAMAPHIIKPMRFVLPIHKGMRPAWFLRLGLLLYDHIGGRKRLPPTRTIDLTGDDAGAPLRPDLRRAFEYSDCWVDDARLVVLNARAAADSGAAIHTRTAVTRAVAEDGAWRVTLADRAHGGRSEVLARLVVNAAGPWVDEALAGPFGRGGRPMVRLVRGSHIVIRRKFAGERAYFFQNADGRIFFAIPYEDDFTLVGTTDLDHQGGLDGVTISEAEIDYLCAGASTYFREPVGRGDIVWTYSAVRPLYDDGASKAQEATRDYVLIDERSPAPLVTVVGGKITTYRRLAEAVMEKVGGLIGARGAPWTRGAVLPGGGFAVDGMAAEIAALRARRPFLAEAEATRLLRLYGRDADAALGEATSRAGLGRDFGHGLSEAEVRYLVAREWARSADDILWRRTKLGLRFDAAARDTLAGFVAGLVG